MLAYWHIHHDTLAEFATEPIENRIAYIKAEKPTHERETRLRLLKPMSAEATALLAEYEKVQQAAWAEYEKVRQAAWEPLGAIHKIECPNCPWDGKTIFP